MKPSGGCPSASGLATWWRAAQSTRVSSAPHLARNAIFVGGIVRRRALAQALL
jgi:hypothetical protein